MDDREIIDLFFQRDQEAVTQTRKKYGKLCFHVANNILGNPQDAEECENDTYLKLWASIPPTRPRRFSTFVLTLTRNISLSRLRKAKAAKRFGGEADLALEELEECVSGSADVEKTYEAKALKGEIDRFLEDLSGDDRLIFLYRYWMLEPVASIAERFNFSQPKIWSSLSRSREKLREHLAKEEWI